MIIQCQACQTRFRLADEKIKPGGTKVRCSKCKEIFTVTPAEPEPVEETVDFGSFNMQAVSEETPDETAVPSDIPEQGDSAPEEESFEQEEDPAPTAEAENISEPADQAQGDEIDFSGLEEEMGESDAGDELAEEFSFADTSQPAEDDLTSAEETPEEPPQDQASDFPEASEETMEPGGPVEFDFGDDSGLTGEEESPAQTSEVATSTGVAEFSFESTDDETEDTSGFTFEEGDDSAQESTEQKPADFALDDQDEDNAFSFDDGVERGSDSASEWDDDAPAGDSFDFDEPQFDNDTAGPESAPKDSSETDLQFGEIDFSSDDDDSVAPTLQTDDPLAGAIMGTQDEPESFIRREQTPPLSRDDDNEEPLPVPPPPKKSSLSRIVLLLVLLLVVLGGAAGFLFMQQGSLNLNAVAEYLPFLKDYIGESQEFAPGDRIAINISGSSYVNGQAGQMLVIQGSAVNNHTSSRSSITIKGTLVDAKGKTLLQQTVFCGNALNNAELANMSFSAIEEAMNNEFGDSLSNMNIASGGSIPFTIVFRNLPADIATINVEVVDSKPGGG
jgi:predicted Zn finger-like uncharacterized protein